MTEPARRLPRARVEADALRSAAAAARAEVDILLVEAEERLMSALELESRARDLDGLEPGRVVPARMHERLQAAERELGEAEALLATARGEGRQALIEANEALVVAARREVSELERLGQSEGSPLRAIAST